MEWNCGNDIAEIGWKKKLQLVCGNAIAEIGVKKICGNCGNAIAKNGREKKIVVAEIWGGIKKNNNVLRPQYFYNIFTKIHK